MPANAIDLTALLTSPGEEFLLRAYREIVGREPDPMGLMHYAKRLQDGVPRVLILLELRDSEDGQAHAANTPCPELDRLVARYRRIRDLPIGVLRWKLLPNGPTPEPEPDFHWGRWANRYLEEQPNATHYRAQISQSKEAPLPPDHVPSCTKTVPATTIAAQLDSVACALQGLTTILQEQGVKAESLQTLQELTQNLRPVPPDVSSVPWEARQALHWLSQAVRS